LLIANSTFSRSYWRACAYVLANIGLSLNTFVFYSTIPMDVRSDYVKNRLGWPNFRFTHY